MAHIKAEVDADITPLEKKLRQAAEKARDFSKEAGKSLNEIGKSAGLGDLGKLLGLGGAAASVTAFGATIVEVIKTAVEEAGKFQTSAFEMGYALKDMDLGTEMTEWAEKTDTAVGTAEDRINALKSLMQSGLSPEAAEEQFKSFADMIAGAGGNMADLAEGFRHMRLGQGEEKTSGMQRLMRGSGAMEEIVRDDKKAYEAQLRSHLAGIPRMMTTAPQVEEEEENLKKVQGMSLTDYAKEFIKPEGMTAMMANSRYTGAAKNKADTFQGSEAAFKQAVATAEKEMGTVILPTLTTWLKTLTADLQDNAPLFKSLGEDIKIVLDIIGGLAGKAQEGVNAYNKATGPAAAPIAALLGATVVGMPGQAVGAQIFAAILEHIKVTGDATKETRDILKATFGTQ